MDYMCLQFWHSGYTLNRCKFHKHVHNFCFVFETSRSRRWNVGRLPAGITVLDLNWSSFFLVELLAMGSHTCFATERTCFWHRQLVALWMTHGISWLGWFYEESGQIYAELRLKTDRRTFSRSFRSAFEDPRQNPHEYECFGWDRFCHFWWTINHAGIVHQTDRAWVGDSWPFCLVQNLPPTTRSIINRNSSSFDDGAGFGLTEKKANRKFA